MPACVDLSESALIETGRSERAIANLYFDDLADIVPGTPACANTAFNETNCYNRDLPPKPSILRSAITHWEGFSQSTSNVREFKDSVMTPTREQTFQMGTRSSLDGRLNIQNYNYANFETELSYFYPENLDYGNQTKPGLKPMVWGSRGYIRPWMRVSTQTNMTTAELKDQSTFYPYTAGADICNKGEESEPYKCRARTDATENYREGLCYDIAIVSSFVKSPELRSNDLTVFVQNARWVPKANDSVQRAIWVYPTSGVDAHSTTSGSWKVLPDWAPYDAAKGIYDSTPGTPQERWYRARQMDATHCSSFPSSGPAWCHYFEDQTYNGFEYIPDESLTKTGANSEFRPIEISTTRDGKVLVGHDARQGGLGLFYAHTHQACKANGWWYIRPVSRAYSDGRVHGTYGFAEYPLVYPNNTTVTPGDRIAGAYPWIDRAGANIFSSAVVRAFGWKECDPSVVNPQSSQGCSQQVTDVNGKNTKGSKVMGLWTRGKIVHLDGQVNETDWTARASPNHTQEFYLALFNDAPWVPVRPGNNTDFFSYENIFNHLDGMTPLLPRDVVWTMTFGSNAKNGEVAFDDFMTDGAIIVAPMNASLDPVPAWTRVVNGQTIQGRKTFRRRNGMTLASNAQDSETEQFNGQSIILQNAAPRGAYSLPQLRLKGGAFIPPISTGVMGKAVYLDGLNDHVEVSTMPSGLSRFYVGAWVELHSTGSRTLFTFPDESIIQVSPYGASFYHSGSNPSSYSGCYQSGSSQYVSGSAGYKRWAHFGFVFDGSGNVDTYIDGTFKGRRNVSGGFSMQGSSYWDKMALGQNKDICYFYFNALPVKAWVDEFKVFEIESGVAGSDVMHEMACNHAMGSLKGNGSCEQINFRPVAGRTTYEDEDPQGVGSGLEFHVEAYQSEDCGSSAHRNYNANCDREARLGVAPTNPDLTRDVETSNDFCLTCHASNGPREIGVDDEVSFDLSTQALAYSNQTATLDRRRQPLHHLQSFDPILWNGFTNLKMGCGVNDQEVGRFSIWWGKVNVHQPLGGNWTHDLDCSSGATVNILSYCQKLFPTTTHIYRDVVSPELKPFVAGSCGLPDPMDPSSRYFHPGQKEFVCCEPR